MAKHARARTARAQEPRLRSVAAVRAERERRRAVLRDLASSPGVSLERLAEMAALLCGSRARCARLLRRIAATSRPLSRRRATPGCRPA
jgi:hypothetical protein